MLIRTPGANDPIIEWSEENYPIVADPPYEPVLPTELQTLATKNKDIADEY